MTSFLHASEYQPPHVRSNFRPGTKLVTTQSSKETKMDVNSSAYDQKCFPQLIPKWQTLGCHKFHNVRKIPGIVYRQKAYFKLKGISIGKIYSLNRSKSSTSTETRHRPTVSPPCTRSSSFSTPLRGDENTINDNVSYHLEDMDNFQKNMVTVDSFYLDSSIRLLNDEETVPLPRIRQNCFGTRKLGTVANYPQVQREARGIMAKQKKIERNSFSKRAFPM